MRAAYWVPVGFGRCRLSRIDSIGEDAPGEIGF